jgi:hypothetical protein
MLPASLVRYAVHPRAYYAVRWANGLLSDYEAELGLEIRQNNIAWLRDVLGNPFRSVIFSPAWGTPTVTSLAHQMYESRDFSPMPILADALEDAGCDHPDVLAHCRGAGPHVRGCWVVDLVLGKS